MLKVALVDDHKLFRKSLAALIGTFDGVEVVYESDSGKDFLSHLKENKNVDIALLDIQMPEMDGYTLCGKVLKVHDSIKVLMISQLSSKETIRHVMQSGAHGFVTKNSEPEQLELAIRNLDTSGFYLGPELGSVLKDLMLYQQGGSEFQPDKDFLSDREKEVIQLICKGKSSAEIAEELFIHQRTVETHRQRMITKVGAKNFIGVIVFALKHNLLDVEDLS
ncbi:response regulator transcription factor [Flavobacterium sp. ST-75]|uniref:Response regulator transcription factor n=1 Tax=Flavobacterium rhizophilum TaxID=3163296 RepID=A0ABW8YF85_9FLAO